MGDGGKSESKPMAWGMDVPWVKRAYENLMGQAQQTGMLDIQPFSMPSEQTAARVRRQYMEGLQPGLEQQREEAMSDIYQRGFGQSPGMVHRANVMINRDAARQLGKVAEVVALENEMQRREVERQRWGQVLALMGLGKPGGSYSVQEQASPAWGMFGQALGTGAGLWGLGMLNPGAGASGGGGW